MPSAVWVCLDGGQEGHRLSLEGLRMFVVVAAVVVSLRLGLRLEKEAKEEEPV